MQVHVPWRLKGKGSLKMSGKAEDRKEIGSTLGSQLSWYMLLPGGGQMSESAQSTIQAMCAWLFTTSDNPMALDLLKLSAAVHILWAQASRMAAWACKTSAAILRAMSSSEHSMPAQQLRVAEVLLWAYLGGYDGADQLVSGVWPGPWAMLGLGVATGCHCKHKEARAPVEGSKTETHQVCCNLHLEEHTCKHFKRQKVHTVHIKKRHSRTKKRRLCKSTSQTAWYLRCSHCTIGTHPVGVLIVQHGEAFLPVSAPLPKGILDEVGQDSQGHCEGERVRESLCSCRRSDSHESCVHSESMCSNTIYVPISIAHAQTT